MLPKNWQVPILEQRDKLAQFVTEAIGKPAVTGDLLDCGSFACVLEVKDTKGKTLPYILKISNDGQEAETLAVLLELNLAGVPRIYGVGIGPVVYSGWADDHYVILSVVEKVVSYGEAAKKAKRSKDWSERVTMLEDQTANLPDEISIANTLTMAKALNESADYAAEEAILVMHDNGIDWLDVHKRNSGWRVKGNKKTLVILDPAGEPTREIIYDFKRVVNPRHR